MRWIKKDPELVISLSLVLLFTHKQIQQFLYKNLQDSFTSSMFWKHRLSLVFSRTWKVRWKAVKSQIMFSKCRSCASCYNEQRLKYLESISGLLSTQSHLLYSCSRMAWVPSELSSNFRYLLPKLSLSHRDWHWLSYCYHSYKTLKTPYFRGPSVFLNTQM